MEAVRDAISRALVHGDFGPSFKYKDFTVTELIGQGLPGDPGARQRSPWSSRWLLGIPLGIFAALHHNSAADYATMSLAVVGIAIPSFVVLPFLGCSSASICAGCRLPAGNPARCGIWCCRSSRWRCRRSAYIARLTRGEHARGAAQPLHPNRHREGSAAAYGDLAARACGRRSCRWRAIWRRRSPRS